MFNKFYLDTFKIKQNVMLTEKNKQSNTKLIQNTRILIK